MGAVYFYHLTQAPLEHTLPLLLGKARGAGWRVLVRGQNPERIQWLDQKLWSSNGDDFLPHGLAGGPHDADQPILLTTDVVARPDIGCVMAIDGAEITPQEVQTAQRVCVLFDGHDPDALAHARLQWKSLTEAGCAAQYWSEEDGRWRKKAEKNTEADAQ